MKENPRNLIGRTKQFALGIIRLYSRLPKSGEAQVLGKQVLRSGTSVGAHYREAQRAKSTPDFVSKIQGALQELDETIYWLDEQAATLRHEADELMAILTAIVKTVKSRKTP